MNKVEVIPALFMADDGKKFDNEADAVLWNAFLEAQREHERAAKKLLATLARTFKTADGVPFEINRWGSFYKLYDFGNEKKLREIRIETERLEITSEGHVIYPKPYPDKGFEEFEINELYSDESKAKDALLAHKRRELEWLQSDIEKLENRRR